MMLLLILMLMVLCWEDHLGEAPIKKLATAAAAATLPWSWIIIVTKLFTELFVGVKVCVHKYLIKYDVWVQEAPFIEQ